MIYNRQNHQNSDRISQPENPQEGKLNAEQVIRNWLARTAAKQETVPTAAEPAAEPTVADFIDDRPAWEKEAGMTPVNDLPPDDEDAAEPAADQPPAGETPEDGEPLGIGYFVARVFTGRTAVPISDAVVTLTSRQRNGYTLVATFRTDENGLTPKIELSAPNRELSEHPTSPDVVPFGIYNVVISHPGYNSFSVQDVQVFDGQTTMQEANLIPIPEGSSNVTQEFTVTPQNL